jgi:thiol:disulfide interchange protein DsbD
VRQALLDFGVTYLKGDWTNRDPDITALLDAHNRAGVPLYLVYPASGAPPRILPQILTESLVVDALAAAAGESPSIPVQTRLQQPLEMDP